MPKIRDDELKAIYGSRYENVKNQINIKEKLDSCDPEELVKTNAKLRRNFWIMVILSSIAGIILFIMLAVPAINEHFRLKAEQERLDKIEWNRVKYEIEVDGVKYFACHYSLGISDWIYIYHPDYRAILPYKYYIVRYLKNDEIK